MGIFKAVPPTAVSGSSFNSESLTNQSMYSSHVRVHVHDLTFILYTGLCIPFSLPWRCPLCSIGKIEVVPRESTRIVVNLRGINCYVVSQSMY